MTDENKDDIAGSQRRARLTGSLTAEERALVALAEVPCPVEQAMTLASFATARSDQIQGTTLAWEIQK